MADAVAIKRTDVKKALERVRKPNGDKNRPHKEIKTFDSIVPDVWKLLMLEGCPDSKMLEMLLIRVIDDLYGNWKQESNKDESRKKARMRDITLMSFGLLDDYPHTKNGVNTWLSDRYEAYLNNSNFVELEYPGEGTYQQIKKVDNIRNKRKGRNAQPRPLNNLTKISGDGRDDVSNKLSEKIKNGTYKQYFNSDIKISVSELTLPSYTTENFSPVIKIREITVVPGNDLTEIDGMAEEAGKSDKIERQTKKEVQKSDEGHKGNHIDPNPPEPPIPIPDDPPDIPPKLSNTAVYIKISTVVLVVSVFTLAIIGIGNIVIAQKAISLSLEELKVVQKPYSIKFDNQHEYLPFGGNLYLTVNPRPDDARLEGLKCESLKPDVVEIVSESELHIRVTEESEDSKERNVNILAYMSYDESIRDEVTIHVIKNGENESMGTGKLDDKESGNSNQRTD